METSSIMPQKVSLTLDQAFAYTPIGVFHYRILLLCGFAFMADALEVNLLSFLSTCAGDEWNLSNSEIASLTSSVFFGIVVGSLFWGIIADRYGRKLTFLIVCFVISIGGFASGLAPTYGWLLSIRMIVGFAIGGANIPFDLLAEFLPANSRGGFLVFIEMFWTIGTLYVGGMAWAFLDTGGWRLLTYVTAIPVALTSVISIYYLPESPRWLLMKGRNKEAEDIVRAAALVNGVTMPDFSLVVDDVDGADVKDAEYTELVRTSAYRKVTFPLWTVWAVFGFTYYGLILLVSRIYEVGEDDNNDKDDSDKTCHFDYADIFINSLSEIAGIFFAVSIIDRWGRRRMQQVTYGLSGVAVFFIGTGFGRTAVMIIGGLGRMNIMAASIGTWVMTPELYNTEMRTVGHAAAVSISKFGAFVAPYVVVSDLSVLSVGVIFSICNIIGAIAVSLLPETKGTYCCIFTCSLT